MAASGMASIVARDVRVDYPILQSTDRSLKRRFVNAATGGRIAPGGGDQMLVAAIDGISFSIEPGERVALVGHNGSGKTTLLRAIAGAYEPSGGSLEVTGTISSFIDISIGFDADATGIENVYLRGFVMGMTRRDLAARLPDIREFSGLGDYLELPLRTYSTGMLLRLAFAVATSLERDIVLMDEWLSVGDADFAARAQGRLREFVDRTSILVLATHSEDFAERFCNRRIELQQGRVVRDERIGNGA
jgi:lipopolysaccharide transport system ATP-binding protein